MTGCLPHSASICQKCNERKNGGRGTAKLHAVFQLTLKGIDGRQIPSANPKLPEAR